MEFICRKHIFNREKKRPYHVVKLQFLLSFERVEHMKWSERCYYIYIHWIAPFFSFSLIPLSFSLLSRLYNWQNSIGCQKKLGTKKCWMTIFFSPLHPSFISQSNLLNIKTKHTNLFTCTGKTPYDAIAIKSSKRKKKKMNNTHCMHGAEKNEHSHESFDAYKASA